MKLTDMGTTGLVEYAAASWRMRGCRTAHAAHVILARHGEEGVRRFRRAVNARLVMLAKIRWEEDGNA